MSGRIETVARLHLAHHPVVPLRWGRALAAAIALAAALAIALSVLPLFMAGLALAVRALA